MPATTAAARTKTESSNRIDIRLRPDQKSEIERAARIAGLTMTDFIVQNAVSHARHTIREHETWTLERPDAEVFAAALEQSAVPGPRLKQAAKRYRERFLAR